MNRKEETSDELNAIVEKLQSRQEGAWAYVTRENVRKLEVCALMLGYDALARDLRN